MADQVIPLTSEPNQTLQVTVNIDDENRTFKLTLRWNAGAEYWVMTIIDASTSETILDSLPLVTGDYPAGNLLGQYGYLNIGSIYLINESNVDTDRPGVDDLGSDWILVWGDTQ